MKPLGVGEIVDVAVNIYTRNWRSLLAVAAVVVVPLAVIVFALDLIGTAESTGADFYVFPNGEIRPLNEGRYLLTVWLQVLLGLLGYLLVATCVLRAVGDAYMGIDPDARGSLRFGLRRLHSVLWIAILFGLAVALIAAFTFFLLGIPAIWLAVALGFAFPVLVFEGVKGRKALDRSYYLVSDNWWRTFGALVIGYLLIILLQFLLPIGVEAVAESISSLPLYLAIIDVALALSQILAAPFYGALLTVIYYDLRVRKEGYDVQLLAEDLEGDGETSQAPPPAPQPGGAPPTPPLQPGAAPPSSHPPDA